MSGLIMTDEIATANAEADTNSVDNTNISVADLANRRLGQMQAQAQPEVEEAQEVSEEVEEEAAEEVIEETEEETQEETEETTEEQSEDVLSQLDLDDMSEEELRELADKLGSRAVARYGELTAKRKSAEERLARLEASLKEKENPLDAPKKVENNPFSNIENIEGLQEKAEEVSNIVEWAEDVLFESDAYAADDVVTEVEGKEMTKAEVRKALLQARKAQKTFLPAQLQVLQSQAQSEQMAQAFEAQAQEELAWLQGEDNDTRKQYEAVVGDKRFKDLKKVLMKEAPDIASQLDYWFAHGVNSIYGRKPVETKKTSPSLSPPKTGNPSAAQPEKQAGRTAKALKELEARFKTSGNPRDFAELRKLKMASRR
jgi:hypothetical protein